MARTVNTLSYAEIASVRNNQTLYETATNYTREEKRSVRLAITSRNEETDVAVETKLASVLDMFSVGSHTQYKSHIGGVRQIGFNLFEIMVKNESAKNMFKNRFGRASTARGSGPEDVFEFMVDDFKGEVENITLYPIPMEMDSDELKHVIEEILNLGAVNNVSWGRHKLHKLWKNGFAHVKDDMPASFLINGRPVTLLKQNQRLYRPCRLCKMRTHLKEDCPSFLAFEEMAEEKLKEQEDREARRREEEVVMHRIQANLRFITTYVVVGRTYVVV